MKYINVLTPDNIDVQYRLAGAGSRLGAAIIDTLIQVTAFAIIIIIAFFTVYDIADIALQFDPKSLANLAAFLIITYFLIFFGYFIVMEIMMKGQTFGKKLFKLRTIRQNGQPITFIQSIIRNLLRVFIDNAGVGIVTIMFSKNARRFGDMLAGTMVIAENPDKISTKSLMFEDIEAYKNLAALNVSYPLSPKEYEVLKDYFARRDSFYDKGAYSQARLTEYFAKKFSLNPVSITEGTLYQFLSENSGIYK